MIYSVAALALGFVAHGGMLAPQQHAPTVRMEVVRGAASGSLRERFAS